MASADDGRERDLCELPSMLTRTANTVEASSNVHGDHPGGWAAAYAVRLSDDSAGLEQSVEAGIPISMQHTGERLEVSPRMRLCGRVSRRRSQPVVERRQTAAGHERKSTIVRSWSGRCPAPVPGPACRRLRRSRTTLFPINSFGKRGKRWRKSSPRA
jgi:hypothetical protein